MTKKRKLLVKCLMTPEGIMLPSFYSHDCKTYESPDGRITTVDGGTNPIYSTNSNWNVTDVSIYDDDPFEVIRRFFCRLNVGKNREKPPTWIPLFKMDDDWLKEVVIYLEKSFSDEELVDNIYFKEIEYRKNNK